MLDENELRDLVLASFKAEKDNDIKKNKSLLHPDFRMIDMVHIDKNRPFRTLEGNALEEQVKIAFPIMGREFVYKSLLVDVDNQKVIVEFIESYPDPATKKVYRTPQIAVCEIKDKLLHRTRHYMDPRLSYDNLSDEEIQSCFV